MVNMKYFYQYHFLAAELKGLDTIDRFSTSITRGVGWVGGGGKFCGYRFAFFHTNSFSEKGASLKGKHVLLGSTFFPFRIDPFNEGS